MREASDRAARIADNQTKLMGTQNIILNGIRTDLQRQQAKISAIVDLFENGTKQP